ncbi:hypothetical protein ABT124_38185 [Streptomyces sp. NPDC001982]|uniref:hypothetical protein n=1 Tax=unclassified Streptomyces TaxID=2593676 RepID=UPI003326EF71
MRHRLGPQGRHRSTGTAPRALAGFRNLAISTIRQTGRANIAHARRDLHDHNDALTVYGT